MPLIVSIAEALGWKINRKKFKMNEIADAATTNRELLFNIVLLMAVVVFLWMNE